MTLEEFRISKNLTLKALADLLGIEGVNAIRTAQRWTTHERIPRREKMVDIQKATGGAVKPSDWPFSPTKVAPPKEGRFRPERTAVAA